MSNDIQTKNTQKHSLTTKKEPNQCYPDDVVGQPQHKNKRNQKTRKSNQKPKIKSKGNQKTRKPNPTKMRKPNRNNQLKNNKSGIKRTKPRKITKKEASFSVQEKNITLSESWFVSNAEYPAEPSEFRCLINGEETFAEIHTCIDNAQRSIEIICWAFQPSMYFKRGKNNSEPPIGELLMKKVMENNVEVKILCYQTALATEKFIEDNTPGRDTLLHSHVFLARHHFFDFLKTPQTKSLKDHFKELEEKDFLEKDIKIEKMGSREKEDFYRKKRSHSVFQKRFDWAWYDAVEGNNTIANEEELQQEMDRLEALRKKLQLFPFNKLAEANEKYQDFIEEFSSDIEKSIPAPFKEIRDKFRNTIYGSKETAKYYAKIGLQNIIQLIGNTVPIDTINGFAEKRDLISVAFWSMFFNKPLPINKIGTDWTNPKNQTEDFGFVPNMPAPSLEMYINKAISIINNMLKYIDKADSKTGKQAGLGPTVTHILNGVSHKITESSGLINKNIESTIESINTNTDINLPKHDSRLIIESINSIGNVINRIGDELRPYDVKVGGLTIDNQERRLPEQRITSAELLQIQQKLIKILGNQLPTLFPSEIEIQNDEDFLKIQKTLYDLMNKILQLKEIQKIDSTLKGEEISLNLYQWLRRYVNCLNYYFLKNNSEQFKSTLAFMEKKGQQLTITRAKDEITEKTPAQIGQNKIEKRIDDSMAFMVREIDPRIFTNEKKDDKAGENTERSQNVSKLPTTYDNKKTDSSKKDDDDGYKTKPIEFKDKELSELSKTILKNTATHHQKTVLIDYETPQSVGFVMGHNMLDRYWDTNEHSALGDDFKVYSGHKIHLESNPDFYDKHKGKERPGRVKSHSELPESLSNPLNLRGRNPSLGAFFGTPRQDVSCKIGGMALYDINDNFVEAWERVHRYDPYASIQKPLISPQRKAITREKLQAIQSKGVSLPDCSKMMVQIVRTQPEGHITEEGAIDERKIDDIYHLYEQNLKMATSYVYFENQYFRFPPFAETLKNRITENRTFLDQHGIPDTSAPLSIFVVTNSSAEGLGPGVMNTGRMLNALGRADVMPEVGKKVVLQEYYQIKKNESPNQPYFGHMMPYVREKSPLRKVLPDAILRLSDNQFKTHTPQNDKQRDNNEKIEKAKQVLEADDLNQLRETLNEAEKMRRKYGIQTHICTIHAPDWQEIYVHSKLTLINDTFTTLGSANINTRSMQIDSEINVAIEDQYQTQEIRKRIWDIHMGEFKGALNPAESLHDPKKVDDIFKELTRKLKDNKDQKESNYSPSMSLLEFDLTNDDKIPTLDLD